MFIPHMADYQNESLDDRTFYRNDKIQKKVEKLKHNLNTRLLENMQ